MTMIKRILPLLRRILGRVKKNMAILFMAFGGILIPLGFYLLVDGGEGFAWYAEAAVILGIMCFAFAVRLAQLEQKEAKEQKEKILEFLTSINQACDRIFKDKG